MTTLTWPTLNRRAPLQLDWSLVSNTQSFTSPLSGAVQSVELPGARWAVAFVLTNLQADDAALMRSFLARLRGQSGRFCLWDFAHPTPRGVATGTPAVNGAAQTGSTLATSGWTPSTINILKDGDWVGINGELKLIVANASSNGAGQTTLTFEPPLRSSPANGAAIVITKPTATFKLDDDNTRWSSAAAARDSFSISATEVW